MWCGRTNVYRLFKSVCGLLLSQHTKQGEFMVNTSLIPFLLSSSNKFFFLEGSRHISTLFSAILACQLCQLDPSLPPAASWDMSQEASGTSTIELPCLTHAQWGMDSETSGSHSWLPYPRWWHWGDKAW